MGFSDVMDVRFVQELNARLPIDASFAGKQISLSAILALNASLASRKAQTIILGGMVLDGVANHLRLVAFILSRI